MILSDKSIFERVARGNLVINPFVDHPVRVIEDQPVISYGLGPAGYDARVQPRWEVFQMPSIWRSVPQAEKEFAQRAGSSYTLLQIEKYPDPKTILDPKNFNKELVRVHEGNELVLPPKHFALAVTLEHYGIPNDVKAVVMAKSTYARIGLFVNTTPIQPGFQGHVVIEVYNSTDIPMLLRANEGFVEFTFHQLDQPVGKSYSESKGVYHGQSQLQHSRV